MEDYSSDSELLDAFLDDNPIKIYDYLYLGNLKCSENKEKLLNLGITDIIRIGSELKDNFNGYFNYFSINVLDRSYVNIYKYFNACYDYIDKCRKENKVVFVHCLAGRSRSVSIIISYIMKEEKLDYNSAFSLIKKIRKIADPNSGFIFQLREYYYKEISKMLTNNNKIYKDPFSTYMYNSKKSKSQFNVVVKKKHLKKPKTLKLFCFKNSWKDQELNSKKVKIFSILEDECHKLKENNEDMIKEKLLKFISKTRNFIKLFYNDPSCKKNSEISKAKYKDLYSLIRRVGKKYVCSISLI